MKKISKIYAILLSIYLTHPVNAYVVQDTGDAFSYKNVARASGSVYQSQSLKRKKKLPAQTIEIGYDKIADKILVDPQPFSNVDMRSAGGLKIKMKVGQNVKIMVSETKEGIWKSDVPQGALELVGDTLSGKDRIFEFKALRKGVYKVFLDNYITQNGKQKVFQSKIVRFNIRAKE